MLPSPLRRLLVWAVPLILAASLTLVLAKQDVPNRCAEWVQPRNVDMNVLARCAAGGFLPSQIAYGYELFRVGRRDEAETWFEAATAGRSSGVSREEAARSIAGRLEWIPVLPGVSEVNAAERWYRRAFELGSDAAAVNLGVRLLRHGDQGGADSWFERSVERSGGGTATMIASNLNGRRDRPQTADEAAQQARWLRRGAELGDRSSMGGYARALSAGRGVERNEAEAFRWYEAAAQHPHANAWDLITLAELHADGKATPRDLVAAAAALDAAKGSKRDSSDTVVAERIRSLEGRLSAAETGRQ